MVSINLLSTAVLAIASVAPWSATAAPSPGSSGADPLSVHNQFRAAHSAPALKWNTTLAADAQNHSNRCVFDHVKGPYGENLGIGYNDWTATITAWYDENKIYDYSRPGYSDPTAHFTQIVWIGTTDVGCGVADCNGRRLYTCRYYPSGNMKDGAKFSANVKAN